MTGKYRLQHQLDAGVLLSPGPTMSALPLQSLLVATHRGPD